MSDSGRVSRRAAAIMVAVVVGGLAQAAPAGAIDAASRTVLISVSSAGGQGNTSSGDQSISAYGRYVAFDSYASNLVAGDTNNAPDVFVRDVLTGRTRLISRSSTGAPANGESRYPSISADGRFVAFGSYASNLVAGDTNTNYDIFVRDVLTGRTRLVSRSTTGGPGDGDSALTVPYISAEGRYVAFYSGASNLVAGDTNGSTDAFVRDLHTGRTRLVSRSSTGTQGNSGSFSPYLSADGRYVAFTSYASNLVPGDTNGFGDAFVRDLFTGRTWLLSRSSTGTQGNSSSFATSISADGRYVVFFSGASNLVAGDTNGFNDVFVRDLHTGRTRLVSRSSTGSEGTGSSAGSSISADGRYVAFYSDASNLVPGDTNNTGDVFRRDLLR